MNPERDLRIPLTQDVDRAPQLIPIALARAALAAIQLALEHAHPILPMLSSPGPNTAELSDSEHLALLAILAADELAERLQDYAAALELPLDSDDMLPF